MGSKKIKIFVQMILLRKVVEKGGYSRTGWGAGLEIEQKFYFVRQNYNEFFFRERIVRVCKFDLKDDEK